MEEHGFYIDQDQTYEKYINANIEPFGAPSDRTRDGFNLIFLMSFVCEIISGSFVHLEDINFILKNQCLLRIPQKNTNLSRKKKRAKA